MFWFLLAVIAGPLARYQVAESVATRTPRGEDVRAVTGRVTSCEGRAAWELTGGAFPRSSARVALAEGSSLTLLDPAERVYAAAGREEFDALFVPRAGAEGGASFTPKDVVVTVTREGSGAPFGDVATLRYRVSGTWKIAMQAPGRAGAIVSELSGVVVVAPDLARTPFDDPMRLVPVRGAVREELARELEKASGLPVHVELTLTSEIRSERVGAAPGAPEPAPKSPKTVTRIARSVSELERRAAKPADAALFAVPEGYRARGLDRIAPTVEAP